MTERPDLSPEVQALLDRERAIPPVPAAQRARALARARAALAAGEATATAPAPAAPRLRWAMAAAAGLIASAAIGAAAYELHARLSRETPVHPPAARIAAVAAPAPAAPVDPAPALAPVPAPAIASPGLSPAEAERAELRLLRQARAAVARRDFAAALPPLAEHARRFKNGRLAEEREALRVRALAGLGRTDEARRAADAFRVRFPRSVLLPAVTRMPASAP